VNFLAFFSYDARDVCFFLVCMLRLRLCCFAMCVCVVLCCVCVLCLISAMLGLDVGSQVPISAFSVREEALVSVETP